MVLSPAVTGAEQLHLHGAGRRQLAYGASLPETTAIVVADLARFVDWGYQLVKHDFSSYDMIGRFLSGAGADASGRQWERARRMV